MIRKFIDENNKKRYTLGLAIMCTLLMVGINRNFWCGYNVNISFDSHNSKDVVYKIYYYEEKDAEFDNYKVVEKAVKAGKHHIKFELPVRKLAKFRLGFNNNPGSLNIRKWKASGNKVVELNDFPAYKYHNISSHEFEEDGSLTMFSDRDNPFVLVPDVNNIVAWYDVRLGSVVAFSGCLLVLFYTVFYGLFTIIFRKKKKKK